MVEFFGYLQTFCSSQQKSTQIRILLPDILTTRIHDKYETLKNKTEEKIKKEYG